MRRTQRNGRIALARGCAGILAAVLVALPALGAEWLPSWNDVESKRALAAFVTRVTNAQSAGFVPPDARIAVFDNDGTLWPECPLYAQAQFAIDRTKQLAPAHPRWREEQPFRAVLQGNLASIADDPAAIMKVIMATHAGMTTDDFARIVERWITTARNPRFHRRYVDLAYEPMLEVLRYLRANGFKTYIVSGGGAAFMRPWTERVYGIPPEQVIGSTIRLRYELRRGGPVLVRLAQMDMLDDGAAKPINIQKFIGRPPVLAFGNSDGDEQMLEWTASAPGERFVALIHHTDAERECAYDRRSRVGRLDAALEEAHRRGWTVVDMKADWKRVFRSQ